MLFFYYLTATKFQISQKEKEKLHANLAGTAVDHAYTITPHFSNCTISAPNLYVLKLHLLQKCVLWLQL